VLASSTLEDSVKLFLIQRVHGWWRMRGSEHMVTDYVLGVLVAVHLVTALYLFGDGRGFHDSRTGRVVRYCASFTFTLYLFHYPILLLLRAASGSPSASMAGGIGFIGLTLGAVWLIAFATERQLPRWRRMSRAALGLQMRDRARSASANRQTIVLDSLS
jgi:peptidoglycan/LPS O-acetylase OafA/YrhL